MRNSKEFLHFASSRLATFSYLETRMSENLLTGEAAIGIGGEETPEEVLEFWGQVLEPSFLVEVAIRCVGLFFVFLFRVMIHCFERVLVASPIFNNK